MEAIGSPPQIDMDSYYYSGPPTDMADTTSLPKRSRGVSWPTLTTSPCKEPTWHLDLPTTKRTTETYPAYLEASHNPGPANGALDRMAKLQAKMLFGSEDPDVTAQSKGVRANLGITEPLTKPEMGSPSPGLTSLAHDLGRSRVSRLGVVF